MLAIALLLGPPLSAQQISNPKLYEKSLKAASQALEYYDELDDAAERRRVNDIGYELAVVSDYDKGVVTMSLMRE